ncbi:MAG: hypothetical protein U5K37_12565 [Natrialbaceae archaeon]|nr:hypothetical protein [Natrialbaceae archaeon]
MRRSPSPKRAGQQHRRGSDGSGSEAQQVAFAERLVDLIDGINIETLLWLWMYDQGETCPRSRT